MWHGRGHPRPLDSGLDELERPEPSPAGFSGLREQQVVIVIVALIGVVITRNTHGA